MTQGRPWWCMVRYSGPAWWCMVVYGGHALVPNRWEFEFEMETIFQMEPELKLGARI